MRGNHVEGSRSQFFQNYETEVFKLQRSINRHEQLGTKLKNRLGTVVSIQCCLCTLTRYRSKLDLVELIVIQWMKHDWDCSTNGTQ